MKIQTGFTLIEVLIAMLVLAVGLLGLAGLQASSLSSAQTAYNRSQATQLAYDMADRIRANPADANNLATSAYVATTTPALQSSCNSSPGCTPALLAQNDLAQWIVNISNALPSGVGSVTVVAASRTYTITINWDDNRDGIVDSDKTNTTPDDPNFQMSFQL